MKINLKMLLAGALTVSCLALTGCSNDKADQETNENTSQESENKENTQTYENAFNAYEAAYNNTLSQNNLTISNDSAVKFSSGEEEEETKAANVIKKDYKSDDEYEINFDMQTQMYGQDFSMVGYATDKMAYVSSTQGQTKMEMTYEEVMKDLNADLFKVVESSIGESSLEKNDSNGYDISIKLDKDKFIELMDTEYKDFCEANNITKDMFSINEITVNASTDDKNNFTSIDLTLIGNISAEQAGGQEVNITLNSKTSYSDFGSTKIDVPENLDAYVDINEMATQSGAIDANGADASAQQ